MKFIIAIALMLSFGARAQCPDQRPPMELEQDLLQEREQTLAVIRENGKDCARKVAENYAYHAVTTQMQNCTEGVCSPWSRNLMADATAQTAREQLTRTVRELILMASPVEELPQELAARICQELVPENPLALMRKNAVEELLAEMSCIELPVGQSRVVDGANGNIAAGYVLERTGENSYRIGLNVNLSGENFSAEQLAAFEGRMQACVAEWNPALRGPRGELLTIDLTNPARTAAQAVGIARAPQHDVRVHQEWPRANSHNYPRSINCPTIIHELMHLMGLCDEYQEQDPTRGFQCRIVPGVESLMAHQYDVANSLPRTTQCRVQDEYRTTWDRLTAEERAVLLLPDFNEVVGNDGVRFCDALPESRVLSLSEASRMTTSLAPREISASEDSLLLEAGVVVVDESLRVEVKRISCQCEAGHLQNKCRDWITLRRSKLGEPLTRSNCPAMMLGQTTYGGDGNDGTELTPDGLAISSAGTRRSALAPAHFQRILAGTCQRKAQDYNVCSSWAYVSECGTPQSSCFGTPNQCDGPPLQCTNERFLGISSSR